ncbi:amino acid adenylation domain-containing protein [Roseomonas sp. NAR14]|uniref:Amino acid adenylation domain-containing protein n=1 Tax=Roseomonas acroporae TaxID=2937791 RepID=A0A9X1Y7Z9_9PROT|nr:amino acid adenylation domain-containing protein [Roseomonas acroporae]MCK8784777.1 amino acid adenylation domain-containing protein [Roseomonas acroporae]
MHQAAASTFPAPWRADGLLAAGQPGPGTTATPPSAAARNERLHDKFVRWARARPNDTAILHDGRRWTYRELDEWSNQLAHLLRENGALPGSLVGLCLDRSPMLVAAVLAVLKAGAAYVPLDPAYPAERLGLMLADSRPSVLLTRGEARDRLGYDGTVLDLDRPPRRVEDCPREAPERDAATDGLACVFYTSGSTGRPKGVALRHTATAMIEWAAGIFTSGELSRVAATTSICFDPSVFEIFAPLSLGGTMVLKKDLLQPFDPAERPTLLNGVPSAFAELARAGRIPDSVRVINVGGERLTARLAREIYAASRVEQVWNHYGPTEATICTCVALVTPDAEVDPPIGHGIAGALLHVLDDELQPVAAGEVGELFIGGPSLAAGYLNRPDLTAERFLPDPFVGGAARMYRTGDLVRRAPDGALHFVGRSGQQVKFRGVRMELDEIEAALCRLDLVAEAVILPVERNGTVDDLVAVVTARAPLTLPAMRQALRESLPAAMLPTKLVTVATMPLTPSGKTDRQALRHLVLPAVEEAPGQEAEGVADPILSPFEEVILSVFRAVLRQPGLTKDDDFFDHGGDSLLAVNAALRLEELLGLVVPSALLHHGRTASALAPMLQSKDQARGHLTVMQPLGEGVPLFCLPDVFGRPVSFLSFAQQWRGERPVYGLLPGPLEAEVIASPSLEALTRAYRREIEQLWPDGPCLLVGYSAGAIPAVDLACALEAAGRTVTLILIDPIAQRLSVDMREIRQRTRQAAYALCTRGPKAARQVFLERHVPEWIPPAYRDITAAMLQAERDWQPRRFHGRTILVTCGRSWFDRTAPRFRNWLHTRLAFGWHAFLDGEIRTRSIDTDHYQIVRKPAVYELTAGLREALRELPAAG